MKIFEKYGTSINLLILSLSILFLSYRVSVVQTGVADQTNAFINRISPLLNFPDTSRRIIAPPLKSVKEFYFFTGKTISKSEKISGKYDYSPTYPQEIWDGYITEAQSDAGGYYNLWTEYKIHIDKPQKLSGWFLIAGGVFEVGYHDNNDDKIWGQLLFPVIKSSDKQGL